MGNKAVKTGRTNPNTAFGVPQVNSVYDLLKDQTDEEALAKSGNDLLTEDTLQRNIDLANNQIVDQTDQFNQGLTRSLVGRGVSDSGLATTALASGRGAISGELINNALARSFQEKLQARQTGAGLLQTKNSLNELLANFIQNLVGAGITGQTSNYGARAGLVGSQAGSGLLHGGGVLGLGVG